MSLVYIAGPYSQPDPVTNTQAAIDAAEEVYAMGYTPVVPHLAMLWHLYRPHPYEWWLELDLRLLAACDALLRLPGHSDGAEREVIFARAHGISVVYGTDELAKWTP